jgi:LEA14-like dessication related protein
MFGLIFAIVFASPLGTGGCRNVTEFAAPAITLSDLEVRGLSGGAADLIIELNVDNMNNFEITLIGLSAGLLVEDVELGQVNWKGEFDCPKSEEAVVRIPFRMAVGDNSEIFNALIDRRKLMRPALRGESTFARGVVQRTYPLAAEGKIGASRSD